MSSWLAALLGGLIVASPIVTAIIISMITDNRRRRGVCERCGKRNPVKWYWDVDEHGNEQHRHLLCEMCAAGKSKPIVDKNTPGYITDEVTDD